MEGFLCPKKVDEIVAAAHTGAVVVVNLHNTACDSLIIQPGSTDVAHLALPRFTDAKAITARTDVSVPRQRQDHIDRKIVYQSQIEGTYEDMLHMLWVDIAEPVLNFLGYKDKPADGGLPNITWCTTGSLSFLPLHAAGDYGMKPCTLYDCAVSSFTPTVSALLKPRANPAAFCGMVTVGQASTPELPALPGTIAELDRISTQAGNIKLTRLDGDQATTTAVLNALDTHSWVHFACHASQNASKPTASAFHLYDGPLDLGTIAHKRLEHADLAFLSACQTATGDKGLPEEALHLAAGIIMAGYKRVIATMWSIDDSDAPLIAENFYGYMLDEQIPNENKAARALHHAVGCLRKKIGVKEFGRWAPYIHIGL
ncbi:hypothetical protein FRC06_005258 [Ceratobasidium sp. 370]|nr:hypothetical protein FRC06_005258 [Ceratobasidium sp. 370]